MPSRFVFRFIALLTAMLGATAALEARRISQEGGSRVALAAAGVAAAGAAWAMLVALFPIVAIGPLSRLRPVVRIWERLRQEDAAIRMGDPPPSSRRLAFLLVVWGSVCFAANLQWSAQALPDVHLDDQGAYLERAMEMGSPGGPLLTLPQLFQDLRSGKFREDNRHPLYLGLLALSPTEEDGRRLSAVFGAAAFLSGVWLVWRRFSPLTAGVFAVLLGLNRALADFSVMVVCETLLMCCVSLAFFAVLPPRAAGRSTNRRRFRLLTSSALLGLAYLTKATGLLFFGVFLLWLAWQTWPWGDADVAEEVDQNAVISPNEAYPLRQMVLAMLFALIGFLVVAEPLIERNLRVFGNPFYNVNSLLLFADDYGEFDNMLRGGVLPSEAAEDYFATHSIGVMLGRELNGLVWEAFIMLRSLGPQGLDDARILFGIPLAVSCAIGLWFERRPAKSLLIGWIAACWIVFAWYVPIAAGDRFPIPLLLPALAFAAEGAVRLGRAKRTSPPTCRGSSLSAGTSR